MIRLRWSLILLSMLCMGSEGRIHWTNGPVEVKNIYQPGILLIQRGDNKTPLRIRGVQTVGRLDGKLLKSAKKDVESWTSLGPVKLRGSVQKREHILGDLLLPNGFLLSTELVRNGHALVLPDSMNIDLTRSVQIEARMRNRGIWSTPGLDPEQAEESQGRFARVCGDISGVNRSRRRDGQVHLGGDYPRSDLIVRIPAEAEPLFGRFEAVFVNRRICVTGFINSRGLWTETMVYDPSQIRDSGRSLKNN